MGFRVILIMSLISGILSACQPKVEEIDHRISHVLNTETTAEEIFSLFKTISRLPQKQREMRLEDVWNTLKVNQRIPFTSDSTVLWLYRGKANSVSWNGAFNKWGQAEKWTRNKGTRISGTDIWYLMNSLPPDARLEYKIVLDEPSALERWLGFENNSKWITDPNNSFRRKGGFGDDSEVRMPLYQPPAELEVKKDTRRGKLSKPIIIESPQLNRNVRYWVYLPTVSTKKPLNVVYVLDGQEYMDPELGAMTIVLDQIFGADAETPIAAVFIDAIDPDSSKNHRMKDFVLNQSYLDFITHNLISDVEEKFSVGGSAPRRAIMGTSLGGLFATFAASTHHALFSGAVIHSPAYWYREEIFDIVKQSKVTNQRWFIATGTIYDTQEHASKMDSLLTERGIVHTYVERNESHSWGLWSGLIDDGLTFVFNTL